nr:MAG TPA_asm: Melanocortin-2 receptor accessory protein family [Caudoviricetes sp.]
MCFTCFPHFNPPILLKRLTIIVTKIKRFVVFIFLILLYICNSRSILNIYS